MNNKNGKNELDSPKADYKNTLNLPQTDFPMRAQLAKREPDFLKKWQEQSLYEKILEKNAEQESYILHDGPPYANGSIHFGHILNKTLKDFIVKYKNMQGQLCRYVPGWDCHGLPIEHNVDKKFKKKKQEVSPLEMRQACRDYAREFVDKQSQDFQRLGIFADWDAPYVTMDKQYEASIAEVMAKISEKGQVYRGAKPIHWCTSCQTALAEAEVEYAEHSSPSIFVKFAVNSSLGSIDPALTKQQCHFVIWTTTPWTLPANQAVAVNKNFSYAAIRVSETDSESEAEVYILAEGLLESFRQQLGNKKEQIIARLEASALEGLELQHPFLDRQVPVIFSDHVSLEAGTGCVHIAPGHGQEDYEAGMKYGLQVLNPVNDRGVFTDAVGRSDLEGQFVFKANAKVIEILETEDRLIASQNIEHSYPHCWRCKNAIIFRSTPQYFVSMENNDLRNKALDSIRRVEWIPHWGRDRIYGMVESRSDWCISRQRYWGNPLMTFECQDCKTPIIDAQIMRQLAEEFKTKGADLWFEKSATEILGSDYTCPHCQSKNIEKEYDILDVWFDSGVSWQAVLKARDGLDYPADLYLEGSDQHRGWFHSSLLTSIAAEDQAPYKSVLTHGFVVDGQGKKYSKSAKNYTPPEKLINEVGADILRLWVASEDYHQDIRFSKEIVDRVVESYRKLRNTIRYLLGNLYDFDFRENYVEASQRSELDRYALHALDLFSNQVIQAYEKFEFHSIYHAINNFCINTLSSFYLDILKDRLYASAASAENRRAAQSTLYDILQRLLILIAPILPFTSEEIYQLATLPNKKESVFLEDFPQIDETYIDLSLAKDFESFQSIRDEILKALEKARRDKLIGHSLEAQVRIIAQDESLKLLRKFESKLPEYFIVSQALLVYELEEVHFKSDNIAGLELQILKAEGEKCERCWIRSTTVGKSEAQPTLCNRCQKALEVTLEKDTSHV